MSERSVAQAPVRVATPAQPAVLQRACACGQHTHGEGECEACKGKKGQLQRKLAVGASNNPLEQEADRVADQVVAAPSHSPVSGAPPRIQRFAGQATGQMDAAPASVDRVLASLGRPLEPVLQQDMGQRFGHDFSRVRVHTGGPAQQSAEEVNANAYTAGHNIVFGAGRFAPATVEGRRLLAHELTHVVQQTRGGGSDPAVSIQRDLAESGQFLAPDDLVDKFKSAMDQKFFGKLAEVLVDAVYSHPTPSQYVSEVFHAVHEWDDDYEDNLGAEFVKKLPESKIEQMAKTYDGRSMLTIVYEAIITGDVTEFEREQANKVLMAKARAYKPEDYARLSRTRQGGKRTRIFPIRFMRVTPGQDYAPPLAELMPNGNIRVKYPTAVMRTMPMFKDEVATLEGGFFLGEGEEINPNEIVGIKDYEKGAAVDVQYLPALALIDYSNQAIHSTAGKIVEVSIFAATMGFGGGAAAGGGVAATEVRMTAIWAMRLAKGARLLDHIANFIGIASFVINENSDWIIRKLGGLGKRLVQISNIANSVAGIYGIGRLAQGGYTIVKEMRAASQDAARVHAGALTQEEAVILKRLDDETDAMLKELDETAAKSSTAAVEKPAGATDEITASASRIGIPREKLDVEIADLRKQTANPNKVRQPKDANLDAEMSARGHEFERSKSKRTWCRHSNDNDCELNFGNQLNSDVDGALAKKQAKFDEIERQRKAREAAPPRARDPKREPVATDKTPAASKASIRAKQQLERANTKKALQSQIDEAKDLELQLIDEIDEIKQSHQQRLSVAERAALDAEKTKLANQLEKQSKHREALFKEVEKLEVTPYDRTRAFSYSPASGQEVSARARKFVEIPGQPKKLTLVDEMSGKPIKNRSIDHVVPVDEIVLMKGYDKLKLPEQEALLSRVDNLRMMEKGANSSKGTKRWAKWSEGRRIYGEKIWREMIAEESRLRHAIEEKITEILAARG